MATTHRRPKWSLLILAMPCVALAADAVRAQYGGLLSGAGATNRAMAGTSTAAPLSAAGALYWNPATLSGLPRSELEAGTELLFVRTKVASRFDAGSLGPGLPRTGLAGETTSDRGVAPLPTIGLAYLPEDSPVSFGLGVFALAGFGVDYAASSTNPLLMPQAPNGFGLGPVFTEFQVLQIHPALAYRLTDRLSIGAGPTLNVAKLLVDPFVLAAPGNANGDAFATYAPGAHGRSTWGAGFDVGVYYQADRWAVGASFKSPQWFDTFRLNSTDELGLPRSVTYRLNLPLIVSIGAAYTGLERWLFAADARFIDYANARGLGDTGVAADGRARGTGWRSIFAVSLGTQYQLTDALTLRGGYSWNQNPAPDSQSFINTAAPAIIKHMVSAGGSWSVTPNLTLSVSYIHGFENAIDGPLLSPAGPVPGTSVRNTTALDSVVLGLTVGF